MNDARDKEKWEKDLEETGKAIDKLKNNLSIAVAALKDLARISGNPSDYDDVANVCRNNALFALKQIEQ